MSEGRSNASYLDSGLAPENNRALLRRSDTIFDRGTATQV
jgi:hypothetical protein